MDIIKLCAEALLCCIASVILKSLKSEWGALCALCGGLLIVFEALGSLSYAVDALRELMQLGSFSEYGAVIIKALGISLAAQLGGDVCRELGNPSMADKLEFAGRVFILALCVPLIRELISLALSVVTE